MNKTKLITEHLNDAQILAKYKKRTIKFVDYEDLESAAYLGLVKAASRYEEGKPFKPFAASWIIGEIKDCVRKMGWRDRNNFINVVPLEDNYTYQNDNDSKEIVEHLMSIISKPARTMFDWYFRDEKTLKEIGQLLGVSEARVSYLLKKYKEEARKILVNLM